MKINYFIQQTKQFLMTTAVFFAVLLAHTNTTVAQVRENVRTGNGGSGSEAELESRETELVQIAQKIKKFFLNHPQTLVKEFPEINAKELIKTIDNAEIEIKNDVLKDGDKIRRTCLNYPSSLLIECNYDELGKMQNSPHALFVLVLHEYLGLMGVEKTSKNDPNNIWGYKISSRLSAFVTKLAEYDLSIGGSNSEIDGEEGDNGSINLKSLGNNFRKIKVYYDRTESNERILNQAGISFRYDFVENCKYAGVKCNRNDTYGKIAVLSADISLADQGSNKKMKIVPNSIKLSLHEIQWEQGTYLKGLTVGFQTVSRSKFKNYQIPLFVNGVFGQKFHLDVIDGVLRIIVSGEIDLGLRITEYQTKKNGKTYNTSKMSLDDNGIGSPFYVAGKARGGLDFFKGAVQLTAQTGTDLTLNAQTFYQGGDVEIALYRGEKGRKVALHLYYLKTNAQYRFQRAINHGNNEYTKESFREKERYWQAGAGLKVDF